MAEKTEVKGGSFRDEILASRAEPRPANRGRHARADPLLDRQEEEGRAARVAPRCAGVLLGTILSIGALGVLSGCDKGKDADEIPDAGWDAGSEGTDGPDSRLVAELCGEAGSKLEDNEAFLVVGGNKAVFTKSKHRVGALEVDEEIGEAVLRFEKPNGETMESGLEVVGEGNRTVDVKTEAGGEEKDAGAGAETQTIAFCGIEDDAEGGPAVRIATSRENGFVHCEEVNNGNVSVPVEHGIDGKTVEILSSLTHSKGELAVDNDSVDCDSISVTMKEQDISFKDADGNPAALASRNILLHTDAQTLKLHKLVNNVLETFEVDLYEVDGAAGTLKVGTSQLGTGTLSLGHSILVDKELRITLNSFAGGVPDFSYGFEPDLGAPLWTEQTGNPSEIEVIVESKDVSKTYVVRFSNKKEEGTVDVVALAKPALFVLGSGSEANLGGMIYNSAVETSEAGVTKVTLTPKQ